MIAVPSRRKVAGPGRGSVRRGPLRKWLAGAALVAVLASGCRASQVRIVPPEELPFEALSAGRDELLAKLVTMSDVVRTIRASVTYLASGEILDEESTQVEERRYEPVRGALLVRRPSLIRMNANATLGLVQAFDMSSDGEEFRLAIPARDRYYYGATDADIEGDNPLYNLRPHHVMESLFVDIRPYMTDPRVIRTFVETDEGRRRFYVFSFIDVDGGIGHTLERIWIDRRNLEISRKEVFDEDGALEMQATYDAHRDIGGVVYPGRVVVDRPQEGASLEIEFLDNTQFNVDIDDALFMLSFPPGARSVHVGDPDGPSSSGAAPAAN